MTGKDKPDELSEMEMDEDFAREPGRSILLGAASCEVLVGFAAMDAGSCFDPVGVGMDRSPWAREGSATVMALECLC